MASLTFKIKYSKNENLVLSPAELLERHLFGISICKANGEALSYDVIKRKIIAAQSSIENFLSIKLDKQIVKENKDFIKGEWMGWGYIRVSYQVRKVMALEGFLNTVRQITYPSEWVSVSMPSDEKLLLRNIHLVPAGGNTPTTGSLIYAGITPHLGFFALAEIPNYWTIHYCSGFENIPYEITEVIEKLAVIQVLAILGDIPLGAGISSSSLSLDGLSQSISTVQSAESSLYSARIKTYANQLLEQLPALRDYYKGITWTVA